MPLAKPKMEIAYVLFGSPAGTLVYISPQYVTFTDR